LKAHLPIIRSVQPVAQGSYNSAVMLKVSVNTDKKMKVNNPMLEKAAWSVSSALNNNRILRPNPKT
jgi:hypothetical protein